MLDVSIVIYDTISDKIEVCKNGTIAMERIAKLTGVYSCRTFSRQICDGQCVGRQLYLFYFEDSKRHECYEKTLAAKKKRVQEVTEKQQRPQVVSRAVNMLDRWLTAYNRVETLLKLGEYDHIEKYHRED